MTTMLEKAARAMVAAQGDDYDALPEIGRRNAQAECRAALEAIREPDDGAMHAAAAALQANANASREIAALAAHKAMTDAILNEKPETT